MGEDDAVVNIVSPCLFHMDVIARTRNRIDLEGIKCMDGMECIVENSILMHKLMDDSI